MKITPKERKAHLKLGRFGENTAVALLRRKGCTVLARNFKLKSGELDIVALDGTVVVFVEVKTRRDFPGITPGVNLSLHQLRRNRITGNLYLKLAGVPDSPHRFDLIEVTVARRNTAKILRITHSCDILPRL